MSESDLLSDHAKEVIEQWKSKFPEGRERSAVISALHVVQHENDGYLTAELMNAVADYLGLPTDLVPADAPVTESPTDH